jgi:hypothetical protein
VVKKNSDDDDDDGTSRLFYNEYIKFISVWRCQEAVSKISLLRAAV